MSSLIHPAREVLMNFEAGSAVGVDFIWQLSHLKVWAVTAGECLALDQA